MSTIKLPIVYTPIYLSRYESAVYYSVLQAQNKNISPWLSTQMINFYYNDTYTWKFDTLKSTSWFDNEGIFLRKEYLISTRIPGWNKEIIFEIIKNALNRGQYVHAILNSYHIKDDEGFGLYSKSTKCLVYGYDDSKKIVYGLRFLVSEGIKKCSMTVDEFTDSLCNKEDNEIYFELLEFNNSFNFAFNIKKLYNDTYDFLNSTSRYSSLISSTNSKKGIEALEEFRRYLLNISEYDQYIDKKYYTAFFDFQISVIMRLDYLSQNNILKFENYKNTIAALKSNLEIFYDTCRLFNLKNKIGLLPIIIKSFDELFNADIEIYKKILNIIKCV